MSLDDGWQTLSTWDVFLAITGVCGIAAAITGGRFGFFRPDLSFNAMTDIFGVIAAILIAGCILFDFPLRASPGGRRLLGARRSGCDCHRGGGLPRQVGVSEDARRLERSGS